MKISTINTLLTICLCWAVILFMIFYLPMRIYDNPPPIIPAYDIAGNLAKNIKAPSPETITLNERLAKGSAANGRKIYSDCATCHAPQKNGTNRVGPPLWGLLGRPFANIGTFSYSRAMRRAAAEGKRWDFETLYTYLKAPQLFVKGTTMAYAGVKNDQDRADLILYLRSLADKPQPLPGVDKKGAAQ